MAISENIANAKCIASTGDRFCRVIPQHHDDGSSGGHRLRRGDGQTQTNFFREAQFTADGTCIVTHSQDHSLRAFVLPHDLLDETSSTLPHELTAHNTIPSPSAIRSFATYPRFDLTDASTTVILTSSKDVPITLYNALADGYVHAKYPLINSMTEEYISPTSLLWTPDGSYFVAGSKDQISIFDSTRDGSGPLLSHRSSKKQNFGQEQHGTTGMKCRGLVTALNISTDGLLATGTTSRLVTIFEHQGAGECVTSFQLESHSATARRGRGNGVMQLGWSPCGTYLLIAERQSDRVEVYDMRNTLTRLGSLVGRKAETTQRLGFDVLPTSNGYELWAGGTDGCVRMWTNPGSTEGDVQFNEEFKAHDDAVSSTKWHPRGAVLATCSGQRHPRSSIQDTTSTSSENDEDNYASIPSRIDNTLKVWSL